MALQTITDSQVRLTFDAGIDAAGSPLYKYKSFNNVKTTSTADNLFSIANALAPLQQYPLIDIERNDSYDISGV